MIPLSHVSTAAPCVMQAASKEMKQAFKANKELQIDHIESLQDDLMDLMVRKIEAQRAQHAHMR